MMDSTVSVSRHVAEDWLTTAEVARRFGISVRRVQALIRAGRLPARKHGRDWLIASAAIETFPRRPPGRPQCYSA